MVNQLTLTALDLNSEVRLMHYNLRIEIDQDHTKFVIGSNADVFPSLESVNVHRVHASFFTSLAKARYVILVS